MAKIIDHLSQGEILAQMAEELAEAAQAALKLRRALDDSNPTPNMSKCGEKAEPKMSRWKQRLEARYAKNEDDTV